MAVMIAIEGQQGFKAESKAATVIALRMGGFVQSMIASNSEQWTKDGKPAVTISNLNPMRTSDR